MRNVLRRQVWWQILLLVLRVTIARVLVVGGGGVVRQLLLWLPLVWVTAANAFVLPQAAALQTADADSTAPVIQVPKKATRYDLKPGWESIVMDREQAVNLHPQKIWDMPKNEFNPGVTDRKLGVDVSNAYWARFTLLPQMDERNGNTGHLLVPSATIDAVYIWVRPQGGDWQPAVVAGDTFLKTDWTVQSGFASTPLPPDVGSVDVVVRMENHFNLFTRMVWLDRNEYLEGFYYTNRSLGAGMGEVGAMLVLSLSAFVFLRRREFFVLSVLCLAMLLYQLAYSGSGRDAIWGSWARFNAISIEASSYLTACCMVFMVWSLMSRKVLSKRCTWLAWSTIIVGLGLMVWHYFAGYLSPWSNWMLLFYTVLSLLVAFFMPSMMMVLRRDRIAVWVLWGVSLFGIFALLVGLSRYYLLPRDHFYTLACTVFTLCLAVFFVAAYSRYRFGHTVMSEEMALSRSGDRLTGLLDRDGLMQVMALSNLRNVREQGAVYENHALTPVMVVRLRKVEEYQATVQELGSAVVEAAQIRLAYVLKNEFQDMSGGVNIARVQEGCFVLFLGKYVEKTRFQQHATRVVTQLLTMDDLPPYKAALGLQIVLDHVPAYELSTPTLQRLYTFGNLHAEDPRVIMWLEPDEANLSSGGGGLLADEKDGL